MEQRKHIEELRHLLSEHPDILTEMALWNPAREKGLSLNAEEEGALVALLFKDSDPEARPQPHEKFNYAETVHRPTSELPPDVASVRSKGVSRDIPATFRRKSEVIPDMTTPLAVETPPIPPRGSALLEDPAPE